MSDLSPAQQARLARRLREIAGHRGSRPADGLVRSGARTAPLSPEQEQLYYHGFLAPQHIIYNEVVAISKDGPLDVRALREAFNALIARHDIWHTTIRSVDGEPCQVVGPAPTYELPLHELDCLPPDEREERAVAIAANLAAPRYNLRRGPLLRAALVRFDDMHHRLYLALHHLIFDGVTLSRVMLPELVALYDAAVAGRPVSLPEPRIQYIDYALWSREVVDDELRRQAPWWREHLAGAPTLSLPLARERSVERQHRGAVEGFVVPATCVQGLYDLAQSSETTLFAVLMAAFALLLRRYGAGDDIVFATVADLRRRPELKELAGYCLTPVVFRLRVPPSSDTVTLVRAARAELLDALEHVVPFERLVRELQPAQEAGTAPLFQALLVLEPPAEFESTEWRLRQPDADVGDRLGTTKTDFHIELDERPEGHLAGRFFCNADLFEPRFGPQVVTDFRRVLRELTGRVTDRADDRGPRPQKV